MNPPNSNIAMPPAGSEWGAKGSDILMRGKDWKSKLEEGEGERETKRELCMCVCVRVRVKEERGYNGSPGNQYSGITNLPSSAPFSDSLSPYRLCLKLLLVSFSLSSTTADISSSSLSVSSTRSHNTLERGGR